MRTLKTQSPARVARPAATDYRAELEARFMLQGCFLHMDYAVGGDQPRKPYAVVDRVAIIDVRGVLCNDPYWYDETGYDEIQFEVSMAAEDSDVDAILLNICSPGGETDNAFETADVIKAAATKKPIWAVAAPYAFSAAYLLACQAAVIYTPEVTGGVGSIGVYCLHVDYSGALEQAGIRPTFISAGKGKTDGNPYEPLSADAKAALQAEVERLYSEFVSRVSAGRKLAESVIIKLGAGLFEGSKAALGAGLADRAGSPETALQDLAARAASAKQGNSALAAADQTQKGERTQMENLDPNATAGTGAAAPPPATGAAAAIPADVRAAALAEARTYVNEVSELCRLAGKPERVAEFAAAGTSLANVRAALLKEKADAADATGQTRSTVLPHEAADTTKAAKSTADRMRAKGLKEGWLKA